MFENVKFDRFNFSDLYGIYSLYGGNKVNVMFFLNSDIVIEHGLV